MIVEFDVDAIQRDALKAAMVREHARYYERNPGGGYRCQEDTGDFAWHTRGDNHLVVNIDALLAVFYGRRGGLVGGGFLGVLVPVLLPSVLAGRWRYRETMTPDWGPFDVKGRPYIPTSYTERCRRCRGNVSRCPCPYFEETHWAE